MSKIFSQSPYFDDFDAEKNFYKILMRPGYAIQTREFNQMQTILQNQIESVGSHLFQDGAMVIPGFISYDSNVVAIKLQSTNPSLDKVSLLLPSLLDTIITGQISGAQALVVHYDVETAAEANTIYVRYIRSGTTNPSFLDNETLMNDGSSPLSVTTIASGSTAAGSLAHLQQGIYYIKGYFVLTDKATITLDKYGVTPSYRVGLAVSEDVITSDDDDTLNDNAIGEYNANAPGAHRYKISTKLVKLSLSDPADANFVELLRINGGIVENKVIATDYAVIEQTLARRTFDESGDYTVTPFKMQLKEHRNNSRGARVNSTAYLQGDIIEYTTGGATYTYECVSGGVSGAGAPSYIFTFGTFVDGTATWQYTETPVYNRGAHLATDTVAGDATKMVVALEGGKAYVKGFELDKFGTSYVDIAKPREYGRVSNASLAVATGNYVRVSAVNTISIFSIPETLGANFPTVDLHDQYIGTGGTAAGTKIGTAVVTGIEPDDTVAGTWKVFLHTIKMDAAHSFDKDVKSLYYNNTTLAVDFTASITPVPTILTGSVSVTTTAGTGVGTLFLSQLRVGDYVAFSLVGTVTWHRISAIASDTAFTLETSIGSSVTGQVIYRASAAINEPNNYGAYVPFPNAFIRNVKTADDITSDTEYTITRNFGSLAAVAGVITITLLTAGETFASVANATNFATILNSSGVYQSPTYSVNGASTVLTISGLVGTSVYTVLGTVQKFAVQRTKTLTIPAPIDLTTASTAQAAMINLGKADCYRLLSVKMAPAFGAITGGNLATIDITDNYSFDTGQRATHYDRGTISLKTGYFPPSGSIRIVFEYFAHGAGDYFSMESYANVIPYGAIDAASRDALDFRPSMNDSGTGFDGSNSGILKRGYNIGTDYSYYLGRIDALSIDTLGNFFVTKGVPSLKPTIPAANSLAMLLAIIYLQPYGIDTTANSIHMDVIDNKRYTMRDIGALEKRINNIEYYASLSMLEQETKSLSIQDANGLERYKNGFLVDGFVDHGIGSVSSLDYRCSIDGDARALIPQHNVRNVNLYEKNSNAAQRTADGYAITGDVITLPYTNMAFISQPYASMTKNINPFAIFSFVGTTQFTPSSDNWFETSYAPDAVSVTEGNYALTVATLTASGTLGTKWNAWQTTWTGVTRSGLWLKGDAERKQVTGWIRFSTPYETQYVTTTVQKRTGISTKVVESMDSHEVGDKLISTSVIPYMRQRNVLFLARGLKPNTVFYPFFDNTSIAEHITVATKILISSVSGYSSVFDYTTNVGGSITDTARMVNGVVDSAFGTGDIITGSTSGATGIVTLQENTSGGSTYVYVVNVKGTFVANETIVGNLSSARATVTSIVVGVAGNSLVSNLNGAISGVFSVPNTDKLRFRTGDRVFTLTTQTDNGSGFASLASATFTAAGVLNTRQKTIESVRNAKVVTSQISENNTVVSKGEVQTVVWTDPLAQTFLVKQNGGAFLTKVDIYFASKDANIPVTLEIRETVNGYPGKVILPLSTVTLNPEHVVISNTSVVAPDTQTYGKDDAPTSFVFPSPVYVKDSTEYCIVLLSDSNNYNVWISQLGDKQIGSDRYISEQPYAGVLFESQNASTWTANQLQDLKFVIHRAKFATNTVGTVNFMNTPLGTDTLSPNSLQTVTGSNVVRVYHYNHGMVGTDSVVLSGIAAGTYNNIPAAELTGTKTIANVDLDSYTITTTTNANATGFTGGTGLRVTFNAKYDSIEPSFQTMEFPDAGIAYGFKSTTTGSSLATAFSALTVNDTTSFDTSKIVASQINESTKMASAKSLQIAAALISVNDAVSPVIDTHRTSALCITNRISNTTNTTNVSPLDIRLMTPAATSILVGVDGTNEYFTTADAATRLIFLTAVVGKYLTTSGFANGANNATHLITGVATDGSYIKVDTNLTTEAAGATVSVTIGDYFVHEITPINGSAAAKYVTKIVTLANLSTTIKVMHAYTKPVEASIDVYYRIGSSSALDALNSAPYILMTNEGLVSSDGSKFTDTSYILTELQSFTAIQVKIVMRSTSTAKVPALKDLRILALA
jgi:hypothetical protein